MKRFFITSLVVLSLCLLFSLESFGEGSTESLGSTNYVEKSQWIQDIPTNFGKMDAKITTEAKVLTDQKTGEILQVEDFGNPYISVNNDFLTFDHGGFNINRVSSKSGRFSLTGKFIVTNQVYPVGKDIISYSIHQASEPVTIRTTISW